MSINHLDPNAPKLQPNDAKPRIFSMNTSRGLLENKRINSHTEQPSNRTFHESNKAPRISLNSLLANSLRSSTPINHRRREADNVESSPCYESSTFPERAYIQPNRPSNFTGTPQMSSYHGRLSVRPNPCDHDSQESGRALSCDPEAPNFDPTTRIQESRNEAERMELMYRQTSRDLDDCRLMLVDAKRQNHADTLELKSLRPSLTLAREKLAVKETELASTTISLSETKTALNDVAEKRALLTDAFNQEKTERQKLAAGTDTLKSGLVKLSSSYAELAESFKTLKTAYETSQKHLRDVVADAAETRKLAKDGLAAITPMLDEETNLTRAMETKGVINELTKDLLSSNQVNDMLRDKLHYMASQLCDAQGRVKELEEEKRGALNDLVNAQQEERRQFETLLTVERTIEKLSEKLSTRERESIDALANAYSVETKLTSALSELECARSLHETQNLEIQTLRTENSKLDSDLLALQNAINARERDLLSTKVEVKSLTESKAELRALLAECKKDLSDKIQELQARDLNIDMQIQIRELELEISTLQSNLKSIQEKYEILQKSANNTEASLQNKIQETDKIKHELLIRNQYLQESLGKVQRELEGCVSLEIMESKCRFLENQLSDVKNESKELRLQLHESENSRTESLSSNARLQESLQKVQAELESSVPTDIMDQKCGQLEVQLSISKNQSKELAAELEKSKDDIKDLHEKSTRESSELKERINVQSIELFRCKEECAVSKERVTSLAKQLSLTQSSLNNLEQAGQSLAKAQENRVLVAEKTASLAQARFDCTAEDLRQTKAKLDKVTDELIAAKESAARSETSSRLESIERSETDRELIEDLERKTAHLTKAADEILIRYKSGFLTDKEKELVGLLMDETERIHTESVVKKDSELRRRQLMVDDLKFKNAELQGTIARLLKEKEKESRPGSGNKSIIGFRPWVSSSPSDTNNSNKENVVGPRNEQRATPAIPVEHHLPPTSISAPLNNIPTHGHHKVPNVNQLHDNAESEDDIPLSELSSISEGSVVRVASGQKRTRSPPPSVDEGPNPSKRRTKVTIAPPKPANSQPSGTSPIIRKKTSAMEGGAKSKQKKRK